MSLSISHAVLIRNATRLAGNVAGRVSHAIGFDDVLHGPSVKALENQANDAKNVDHLKQQLSELIQRRLSAAGIATSPPVQLSVIDRGALRVEGNHPRAAEIELLLNSDRGVTETARQLRKAAGQSPQAIDLTIPPGRENMVGPGGYPNW